MCISSYIPPPHSTDTLAISGRVMYYPARLSPHVGEVAPSPPSARPFVASGQSSLPVTSRRPPRHLLSLFGR